MKNNSHFLSVIIPVYKQEKTIIRDLKNIDSTLKHIRYDYEIIAVIDGRSTDHSYRLAKTIHNPKLKILSYRQNRGKGFAVRYGMKRSKGDYVAFIDAGMEIDPNGISMVLEHMEWYNADIIVASKRHPASKVSYPFQRKLISFLAYIFSSFFLGIRIRDTQAGLKIFKRRVLNKVLPRLLVKEYAFDLEILAVSKRLGFTRIYEAPIKLQYDFTSLTHAAGFQILFKSLLDAMAVVYRLHLLRYYDDSSRRHSFYDPDLKMKINTGQ